MVDHNIREIQEPSRLERWELERILHELPIIFFTCEKDAPYVLNADASPMDVYHAGRTISMYPPEGRRLQGAYTDNETFPLRLDSIMDDSSGLRCSFCPELTNFGIPQKYRREAIDIDIFKYPREMR